MPEMFLRIAGYIYQWLTTSECS